MPTKKAAKQPAFPKADAARALAYVGALPPKARKATKKKAATRRR